MTVQAEQAIRAWVNARPGLTGNGNPLALGAFLLQQRSPDAGCYAVLTRQSQAVPQVVAEGAPIDVARISAIVYGGTQDTAEAAAAAYANAVQSLTGAPQPCGDTGVTVLVSDNLSGPMFVAMPSEGGEQFAFEVAADFSLLLEA